VVREIGQLRHCQQRRLRVRDLCDCTCHEGALILDEMAQLGSGQHITVGCSFSDYSGGCPACQVAEAFYAAVDTGDLARHEALLERERLKQEALTLNWGAVHNDRPRDYSEDV
jgi:hypothetical protein